MINVSEYIENGYKNAYIGVTNETSTCELYKLQKDSEIIYYRKWNGLNVVTDCNGDCWFKIESSKKNTKKLDKVYANILKEKFKEGLKLYKKLIPDEPTIDDLYSSSFIKEKDGFVYVKSGFYPTNSRPIYTQDEEFAVSMYFLGDYDIRNIISNQELSELLYDNVI